MSVGTSRPRLRAILDDVLLPLLVYGATAIWFTWPLAAAPREAIVTSSSVLLNDLYLVLWILSWLGRALVHAPQLLFEGEVLHPTAHALARAEHLIGELPLFLPVWLATGDVVLGYNVITFASYVLTAMAMQLLAREWTGSRLAGWVAGAVFAFAPWRGDIGRPQLLQVQYVPLVLYGLDRAVASGRVRIALLTAAALALQVLSSYYLGYIAYVLIGTYVVVWLFMLRTQPHVLRAWRAILIVMFAPLVVVGPLSIPYLRVRSEGTLTAVFARTSGTLFEGSDRPLVVLQGYVGWGTVLVALVALALGWRGRDVRDRQRVAFLSVAAVAGVLLATGPDGVLGGWLAPFSWLSAIVPGFSNLRVPTRFGIASSFAASGLVAYAVAGLEHRAAQHARRAGVALGVAVIAVCLSWAIWWPWRFEAEPVKARLHAPVYQWLRANGRGRPLLELPTDPLLRLADARAMVASSTHGLPVVNGYTGYMPPGSLFLLEHAEQLPALDSLQVLADCAQLEWILVHRPSNVRIGAWSRAAGVRLVGSFPSPFAEDAARGGRDDLYQVTVHPAGACPGLSDARITVRGTPVADVGAPRGELSVRMPKRIRPVQEIPVELALRNDGDVAWPTTAVDPHARFKLWYGWVFADGGPETRWRAIPVARDVVPGETVEVAAWLAPPGAVPVGLLVRAGQGADPDGPDMLERRFDVAE